MKKYSLILAIVLLIGTVSLFPILVSAQSEIENGEELLGDVNLDGNVTMLDMILVAEAIGSMNTDDPNTWRNETKNWNPDADLNSDGMVNIIDLAIVAINFGDTRQQFFTIPEYWLGPLMALIGCFAAFGAFYLYRRRQF